MGDERSHAATAGRCLAPASLTPASRGSTGPNKHSSSRLYRTSGRTYSGLRDGDHPSTVTQLANLERGGPAVG